MKPDMNAIYEQAARILAESNDYRLIRRFNSRDSYGNAPEGVKLAKGIILDTETTGRDPNKDKIIELGMILFEYDPVTGQAFRILDTYNALEDPGMPIPPEASSVNGITDDMVAGLRLDDAAIENMVLDADILIAHNSQFDRAFLERRMPVFMNKPWGCSRMQINWEKEGIGSQKLDYIAYRFGFFYEAHRAEADCRALLEMLQQTLPTSQVTGLKSILNEYRKAEISLAAVGAPFDAKDVLKARGYRWDPNEKFWHTRVTDETFDAEVDWIRTTIYGGKNFRVSINKVDAFNRFSDRPVQREVIYV